MEKHYQTGLWIDGDILHSELSLNEKAILADIYNLSTGLNVCIRTNESFSKTYKMSVRTVQRIIASLRDKNLIKVKLSRPYEDKTKSKRLLTPIYENIKLNKKIRINCNNFVSNSLYISNYY